MCMGCFSPKNMGVPCTSAWRGKHYTLQVILSDQSAQDCTGWRHKACSLSSARGHTKTMISALRAVTTVTWFHALLPMSTRLGVYDDATFIALITKLRPATKSNQFHIPQKKTSLPETGEKHRKTGTGTKKRRWVPHSHPLDISDLIKHVRSNPLQAQKEKTIQGYHHICPA